MKTKKPKLSYDDGSLYRFMGTKVFVYWNLHKNCWSLKNVKTGLVIGHTNNVYLRDCIYKVSESGRQRVLKQQRKNVHAGVQGYITINKFESCRHSGGFTYNPYKYKSFIDRDSKQNLFNSDLASMSSFTTSTNSHSNRKPLTLWGNYDN